MRFKVGDKVFYKMWVNEYLIRTGVGFVTYVDDSPFQNYLVDIGVPDAGQEREQWFSESDLELLGGVAEGQLQLEELVEDKVNSPNHYNTGRYEVIDLIEKSLAPEEFRGYLKGNVIKYLMRYQFKNGVEDLKKATKYIEFLQRLFTGWDK